MSGNRFTRNMLYTEVGYASEEFTSAFEIRENTAILNQIHGFQQLGALHSKACFGSLAGREIPLKDNSIFRVLL
ncbi:hypothetical protein GCM10023310_26320 [Paenibacillus vulneris]